METGVFFLDTYMNDGSFIYADRLIQARNKLEIDIKGV